MNEKGQRVWRTIDEGEILLMFRVFPTIGRTVILDSYDPAVRSVRQKAFAVREVVFISRLRSWLPWPSV